MKHSPLTHVHRDLLYDTSGEKRERDDLLNTCSFQYLFNGNGNGNGKVSFIKVYFPLAHWQWVFSLEVSQCKRRKHILHSLLNFDCRLSVCIIITRWQGGNTHTQLANLQTGWAVVTKYAVCEWKLGRKAKFKINLPETVIKLTE